MTRIALVSHCHHPLNAPYAGGLEAHTDLLARRLVSRGIDVTVLAKGGTASDAYKVIEVLPETWVVPTDVNGARRQDQLHAFLDDHFAAALAEIDPGEYDAVINNTLNPRPLVWSTPLPKLTLFHTPPLPEMVDALGRLSPKTDCTYASVSAFNASQWQPFVGDSINVVHNGVDLSQWQQHASDDDSLCWSARIIPDKGLPLAIAAARTLDRPLRIAGPIQDIDYFDNVISSLLGGSVEYLGHLDHDEIAELYRRSSVMLATPLWDEPFGLSAVEALASGTPVASLHHGAVDEILGARVGAISDRDDATSLAVAVEAASRLDSSACRTHAETRFDIDRMVDDYLELLRLA